MIARRADLGPCSAQLDPVAASSASARRTGRPGQHVIGHADHATAAIRGRSTTLETDRRRSSRQAPVSHDDGVVDDIAALLADEGMLLESARGPIPNVAELVVGAPIRGSWWAHPQSHRIFATINALADSPDVARMRLVNGRITLVHRRLWPALLRLETRFPPGMLVVVLEEHTPTGAHRVTECAAGVVGCGRCSRGGCRAGRAGGADDPARRDPRPPRVTSPPLRTPAASASTR